MIGNSYCLGSAIKTIDGRRATILDRIEEDGLIELVIRFDQDSIVDGCMHAMYWPRRSQIWDMRLQ